MLSYADFRFVKTSVVVVGAFNVHIIHPEWLRQIKAIGPADEFAIQVNFSSPGVRFRMPNENEMTWTIQPDRIVVESNHLDDRAWKAVEKVIAKLPWTPLTALGVNLHYKVESLQQELFQPSLLGPGFPAPNGETYHLSGYGHGVSFSTDVGLTTCNLSWNTEADGSVLLVNYNTDLQKVGAPEPQLNAVKDALSRFDEKTTSIEPMINWFLKRHST